jgi:hypothetical protein
MGDILLTTYILGVVFWGGLFASAVWKFRGFQGYADYCNKFFGDNTPITSNRLQWHLVIYTLAWPFIIPLVALLLYAAKKLS